MSDRALLELAAKAAGIALQRSRLDDPLWRDMLLKVRDPKHGGRGIGWNPLIDDGDALRLAAKLHLWEPVRMAHRGVSADTDIYAATRRAIVEAAAEIGRTMP